MEARGVDFFAYQTADMPKAIAFYRDVLGLAPIGEFEHEGQLMWAEFEVGGVCIAVHPPEMGPPVGCVGLSVEDVEATVAELREKGVTITFEPTDTPVCKIAGIADQDGNPIILHARHDGTAG